MDTLHRRSTGRLGDRRDLDAASGVRHRHVDDGHVIQRSGRCRRRPPRPRRKLRYTPHIAACHPTLRQGIADDAEIARVVDAERRHAHIFPHLPDAVVIDGGIGIGLNSPPRAESGCRSNGAAGKGEAVPVTSMLLPEFVTDRSAVPPLAASCQMPLTPSFVTSALAQASISPRGAVPEAKPPVATAFAVAMMSPLLSPRTTPTPCPPSPAADTVPHWRSAEAYATMLPFEVSEPQRRSADRRRRPCRVDAAAGVDDRQVGNTRLVGLLPCAVNPASASA